MPMPKPHTIIDATTKEIEEFERLEKYDGPDKIISSFEMLDLLKEKGIALKIFPTGFPRIDEALGGGFQTGELIAVGGPSKNGKTLWCQSITKNLSKQCIPAVWFSFEVPMHQFMKAFNDDILFYLPRSLKQSNLEWMRNRLIEAKEKRDCRVAFLDNLHHLLDFETMRNTSLEIGSVIRFMKRMAIELNIVIVIICHSKKPENPGDEVNEWQLRDSSFIPQESDATIMIQREFDKITDEALHTAIVKICLHRRTGVMGRKIDVIKSGYFLKEAICQD